MQFKTQRYEAVEIAIPSGSTSSQFNFPDLPNLTGRDGNPVIIDSIVVYDAGSLNNVSPLTGQTPLSATELAGAFLTIYQGDLQILFNFPLAQLNFMGDPATTFNGQVIAQPLTRDLINISWTKSFVRFPAAAPTANRKICFGIHYTVITNTPDLIPTKENVLLDTLVQQNQMLFQLTKVLTGQG